MNTFIKENLTDILEVARVALWTKEYLDLSGVRKQPWLYIAEQLDLSDEAITNLRIGLADYLIDAKWTCPEEAEDF
jgi:hypothetical protein